MLVLGICNFVTRAHNVCCRRIDGSTPRHPYMQADDPPREVDGTSYFRSDRRSVRLTALAWAIALPYEEGIYVRS